MTARPRFTVVIPALDEAAHLERTLESLRSQDFAGGVDIVVGDNGSRDATACVARAGHARVVTEPTRGVCVARQRGTDAAYGEVVVSTDADTVHPRDWLSRIDEQLRRHPNAVAVAGPCVYTSPPWWAGVMSPLWFAGIARVYARTGRVLYLTATNVAFYRAGFPGYDLRLNQGGDEVGLLTRLRDWGLVVWDDGNAVTTSSRRLDQGLAYTLLVSFGYYYAMGSILDRFAPHLVSVIAPAIRPADHHRVARRRRRWRTGTLATLAVATSVGLSVRRRRR